MVFSSLFFVLVFLVLCYSIYAFMPSIKAKNIVLLVSSLIFYAWGGPALVLLLLLMTFICWTGAFILSRFKEKGARRTGLVATVGACLVILFVYKYTGFLFENFYAIFNIQAPMPSIVLPIGISFYTFQLISYVVDVYRGEVAPQRKYWLLLLYVSLFHQCIAGPIVRYSDVNREIEGRYMTLEDTTKGISRFAVGLAKKAILADTCAVLADKLAPQGASILQMDAGALAEGYPVLWTWLGIFCYMLQIYLDFSAYSDMAIGMGMMIGFHYRENFNYPYTAHSVTDFWRRWHISLSSFFRDYVYIPLGGNRCSAIRQIFNMFVVWALTGFWHGASWNYLIWGLYYFVFLAIEKYIIKPSRDPKGPWRVIRVVPTMLVVFFGWVIFRYEDLSALWTVIKMLFGFSGADIIGSGATLSTNLSTLTNYLFFFVICVLACMPIIPSVKRLASKNAFVEKLVAIVSIPLPALLILISLFAMAGNTYSPFLYFQF